jgi:hypothetical protein
MGVLVVDQIVHYFYVVVVFISSILLRESVLYFEFQLVA